MIIFIDTSAFIAVLDADDENHQKAKEKWEELILNKYILCCSNYVLLETIALAQHRLGLEAVKAFQEDIVPILSIEWVNETIHQSGVVSVISGGRKKISLVDYISFAIMKLLGIKSVFTFDRHFKEQGFDCVP
jgi:predicted nucleic acid-binding protein